MGIIQGLKSVEIIYTTFIDGEESSRDYFKNLSELRVYFHEHKRAGEAVGYVIIKNRTPGFNDYIRTGKLAIEWTDSTGYTHKDFDNVFQMVDFLKEHEELGAAFGYKKK